MRDQTSWLRLLGGIWFGLGALALLWGLVVLFPFAAAWVPVPTGLWAPLYISPWLEGTAIAVGLFGIVVGHALVRRRSWAQTLLVPAHMLLALYAAIGWIAAQLSIMRATGGWSAEPLLIYLPLIVLHAGLALGLGGQRATEALAWQSLRTAPLIPTRCEYCGSLLDPETGRCPQCDLAPSLEQEVPPPRARLTSISDGETFWVSAGRATLIGRGLSDADISLGNPTVSRQHAQIAYREGHYVLTALHDSNGTFINDTLVRQRILRDGDEVRFGRARFRFELVEGRRDEDEHA
jgi:hypothetical protein